MVKTVCPDISASKKNFYMNSLADELGALRAKARISQNQLSDIIGVSRQTYGNIERKKQKMQWNTFLSLILFFDCNKKTSAMLRISEAFPAEFFANINPGFNPEEKGRDSSVFSDKVMDVLDETAIHTIKTVVMLEYARCTGLPTEEIMKIYSAEE